MESSLLPYWLCNETEKAMTANFALRVAGAQIPVGTDIKANTANLLRAIDIAAGKGADILLTPEG
tara:strand:- start:223 stop:417 length:195 start_codon:yes stop_codon:yes gene_type:complete